MLSCYVSASISGQGQLCDTLDKVFRIAIAWLSSNYLGSLCGIILSPNLFRYERAEENQHCSEENLKACS